VERRPTFVCSFCDFVVVVAFVVVCSSTFDVRRSTFVVVVAVVVKASWSRRCRRRRLVVVMLLGCSCCGVNVDVLKKKCQKLLETKVQNGSIEKHNFVPPNFLWLGCDFVGSW